MSRQGFFDEITPFAKEAAAALGIPWEWVAAHWAHETGYVVNQNNNLAGIYSYPGSPYGLPGKGYASLSDFAGDYVQVMKQDRYKNAYSQPTLQGFMTELQRGGYASDSMYGYKAIWQEVLDFLGTQTPAATPTVPNPFTTVKEKLGLGGVVDKAKTTAAGAKDSVLNFFNPFSEKNLRTTIFLVLGIMVFITVLTLLKGGSQNVAN